MLHPCTLAQNLHEVLPPFVRGTVLATEDQLGNPALGVFPKLPPETFSKGKPIELLAPCSLSGPEPNLATFEIDIIPFKFEQLAV